MYEENPCTARQIDAGSWIITDVNARAFLFTGSQKALLVDSGYGTGDWRKTVSELTNLPVMLVNTHADHDHIGGNKQFERAFMHPAEIFRYRQQMGPEYDVSPIWEGDIIDLGGRKFEVILIPGHSPGSIALLDSRNRILLGGDTVIDDRIVMNGNWRDFDAYIFSLEKLYNMRSRFDVIYSPHGGFPVSSDILEGLVAGAKRVRSGLVEGVDTDFVENAKLYDVGVAKFVF